MIQMKWIMLVTWKKAKKSKKKKITVKIMF